MNKKALFIYAIAASFLCNVAQAQLIVDSSGKAYVQRGSLSGQASLSVGNMPGMESNEYDGWRMGVRSYAYNTQTTGNAIGLFGEAGQQYMPANNFSAGVWGLGGGASTGYNYGVIGSLHTGSTGAAIYGANCDNAFYGLGNYSLAGYFYGPVHIEGSVHSTAGYSTPSDMRLKRDVVAVEEAETTSGSTLENLLGLEVLSYRLELPHRKRMAEDGAMDTSVTEDPNEKYSHLRHYGVSAQELQKVFPTLVTEDANGYLSVNYVEMVPLLIRSLQELRQEIADLRGDGNGTVKKVSRQTASLGNPSVAGGAALHQNTPNPFKEKTTIRFTLPYDAQGAYIYIFDMQGKMMKQLPVSSSQTSVTINGYELQAGLYLYSLVINGQEIDTKRMILSK